MMQAWGPAFQTADLSVFDQAAPEGVGATIAIQPCRWRDNGQGAPQHVGGGHGA
jgi:hypothetical protein